MTLYVQEIGALQEDCLDQMEQTGTWGNGASGHRTKVHLDQAIIPIL